MHSILIVSNDLFLRDMLRHALRGLQVEVRCVDDAGQMLLLCRQVAFDLVIVTGVAAFLRGDDPMRRLRPPGLRRPALFVLSWQQAEQTVMSLLESGVDQYITFPVGLHRLRAKIADALFK